MSVERCCRCGHTVDADYCMDHGLYKSECPVLQVDKETDWVCIGCLTHSELEWIENEVV